MNLVVLARADGVNVTRDPMLLMSSVAGFPLALLMRLGRAPLLEAAAPWASPVEVEVQLATLLCVLPSVLAGTVAAFLLLEERDEGVARALATTPVGFGGLARWRLSLFSAWGCAQSLLCWPVAGFEHVSLSVPVVLAGAAHAPLVAALLLRVARDKVQGLALSKLTSPLALGGLVSWLPAPANVFLAWLPAAGMARGLGGQDLAPWLALGMALVLARWGVPESAWRTQSLGQTAGERVPTP